MPGLRLRLPKQGPLRRQAAAGWASTPACVLPDASLHLPRRLLVLLIAAARQEAVCRGGWSAQQVQLGRQGWEYVPLVGSRVSRRAQRSAPARPACPCNATAHAPCSLLSLVHLQRSCRNAPNQLNLRSPSLATHPPPHGAANSGPHTRTGINEQPTAAHSPSSSSLMASPS